MKHIFIICLLAISYRPYAQTNENSAPIDLYAGYGIGTAQDIMTTLSSSLASALLPGQIKRIDIKGLGAVFGGIDFHAGKRATVGIQINYASYDEKYKMNNGSTENLTTNYLTPMARGKMNWVNKPAFSFYSALAAGPTFISSKNDSGDKDHKVAFAFQLSAIGIRAGDHIAVFLEGGFGFQGILS
jgi:hypothetical protein